MVRTRAEKLQNVVADSTAGSTSGKRKLSVIDFTIIEAWTKVGLVTFYLLFVMELKTRRVHFADGQRF